MGQVVGTRFAHKRIVAHPGGFINVIEARLIQEAMEQRFQLIQVERFA